MFVVGGQRKKHAFWSAPRTRTLARSKTGSPQIADFRLVYADSEISNNGGCQRLLEWTLTTTAHRLKMANVFLVLTKRKRDSGDEIAQECTKIESGAPI